MKKTVKPKTRHSRDACASLLYFRLSNQAPHSICKASWLVIDTQKTYENNTIVLCCNAENKIVINQYKTQPHKKIFSDLKNHYPVISHAQSDQIIGVLVSEITEF